MILVSKLEHFGVRGVAYKLFNDYLSNRTQSVFYCNTLSPPLPITCGVPQGSILGPLLFLIYINDFSRCSSVLHFTLFPDDTTLLLSDKSIKTLHDIVNKELKNVDEWLQTNKLSINISKTNYKIFRNNSKLSDTENIFLNQIPIMRITRQSS